MRWLVQRASGRKSEDFRSPTHAGLAPSSEVPPGGTVLTICPIPASQTISPIDSDDLLSSLDGDTRAWFTSLVNALNTGTAGRGMDIRALLRTLGPTASQMRQVSDLLAARRTELSAIVHNLGTLTQETSQKDAQLRTAIRAGDITVRALGTQNVALQRAVELLPGTLQTARTTLTDLTSFSNVLGPTATALVPVARRLPQTLTDSKTLFESAALLPLNQIPPFINAVLPLARQLPGLESNLAKVTPALSDSFKVLAYVTNETAYNGGGRNPGFLYWLAWFAHNANSFISNSDANGPVWRSLTLTTCAGLKNLPFGPLLQVLLGTNFGC